MDKTERELRDMLADRRLVRWPTEPQWNDIWKTANAKGFTGTVSTAVYTIAPDLLDPDWVGMMTNDQREMMWGEIRVRRSVAPFRRNRPPTPFNPDAKEEAAGEMQEQIAKLVSQHWIVISDGPTGVQLRSPRKLKKLDLLCLIIGLPMIMFYGLGLILVGLALIDHFVLTKTEMKFLPRPQV